MTEQTTQLPRTHGGGRPTRAAALARDERLLDIAARLFEERGYEGTSMDALADAAGVGKATVYARFQDKRTLFVSLYRQRVAALMAPLTEEMATLQQAPVSAAQIAQVLRQIGCIVISRSLSAGAIRMNRVILSEAERFPELAQLAYREGWSRVVTIVGAILQLHADRGVLVLPDAETAADLFLNMVIGRQQRLMMLGIATHNDPLPEDRVDAAVGIFLRGVLASPP